MELEAQSCSSKVYVGEPIASCSSPHENDKEIYGACSELVIYGSEEQRAKMFEAMSKYYAEVQNPENTTTNTFFRAKYAPLNEVLNTIRPIMGKYGLACTQTTGVENGECFVSTLLTHSGGGYIYYPVLRGKPTKQDIQGIGATITYLRRFALNAIAGVSGEVDDDGNSAASPNSPRASKPSASKELDEVFGQIASTIKELKEQETPTDEITSTVKENCVVGGKQTANYRKTTDITTAKKVLEALKDLRRKD